MPSVFVPNEEFAEELSEDDPPLYTAGLIEAATPAQIAIATLAPVGKTGMFKRSIVLIERDGGVLLGSSDPFAHLVEWGSVNNPAYAMIRRGVEAAGLRLEESDAEESPEETVLTE